MRHKVLLTSHENDIQSLVNRIVQNAGDCSLSVASDGLEAVKILKKEDVQLAIIDMAGDSGQCMTLLRVLRGIDEWVPVIIISPGSALGNRWQTPWKHVHDCFERPIEMNALSNSVGQALCHAPGERPREHALPVDIESFIDASADEMLEQGMSLPMALQDFRERYIDLMCRMYKRH